MCWVQQMWGSRLSSEPWSSENLHTCVHACTHRCICWSESESESHKAHACSCVCIYKLADQFWDFLQFSSWAAERWYWAVAYLATCTNLITLIICWTDSKLAAIFTDDSWLQWAWFMISRHTKRCFQPLARTHCECVPSEVNIGYSERKLWIQWEYCQSVARAPLGYLVSVQCQCALTGKRAKTPAGVIWPQQRHSTKSQYCNSYWPTHSYAVQFVCQVTCPEVCSQRDEQRYQPIFSSFWQEQSVIKHSVINDQSTPELCDYHLTKMCAHRKMSKGPSQCFPAQTQWHRIRCRQWPKHT